jgi:hypothetical protein
MEILPPTLSWCWVWEDAGDRGVHFKGRRSGFRWTDVRPSLRPSKGQIDKDLRDSPNVVPLSIRFDERSVDVDAGGVKSKPTWEDSCNYQLIV